MVGKRVFESEQETQQKGKVTGARQVDMFKKRIR